MESSVASCSDIDNKAASQKRLCWVCFGTELDDENSNANWICPCQCKGTMKWVHEECLQRWVDEKQRRTHSTRVSCSQCRTYYILSFPPVNCLVRIIEYYDKLLCGSSPFVAVSIVAGSIYWCFGSYGFFSIIQVMGYEEGQQLIEDSDPLLLFIGLPIIPVALIMAKMIKWEEYILKLWRASSSKMWSPLSYIIGDPPIRPRANCDEILVDPGFNEPLGCTRMICGALLLPTMASVIGKIFFSRASGPQWRRSLLGGLAFLLFKGMIKIYLRKSQYVRYSQRSIKNYPTFKADQLISGSDDGSSSSYASQAEIGADREPEISDDGLPRTRTMFSMTIRL